MQLAADNRRKLFIFAIACIVSMAVGCQLANRAAAASSTKSGGKITGGALYGKIGGSKQVTPRYHSERKFAKAVGGSTTATLRSNRSLQNRRALRRNKNNKKRPANRRNSAREPKNESDRTIPSNGPGTFPVAGNSYTLGGDGARFGAQRTGHSHQGQDIMASEGTPVIAPRDGTVTWRAYQAGGAGYYLVVQDQKLARSYVFMHLKEGSMLVKKGDTVNEGQQIAEVGSTGRSEGPHLHFEIWEGGWYTGSGKPIDPLPVLNSWRK